MSRGNQQLVRAALPLLKKLQKSLGVTGVVGILVLAALYGLVIQPMAAKRGLPLPSLVELLGQEGSSSPQAKRDSGQKEPTSRPAPVEVDPTTGELSEVLTESGRNTYRSNAGLRYTRGSQHGTRLAHLLAHTHDQPNRVGQHGVFDSDDPATVVRLVDDAYTMALSGKSTETERKEDRTIYMVNFRKRIGYVGGQSGARKGHPAANYLRLVVEGDRFITAYPVRL